MTSFPAAGGWCVGSLPLGELSSPGPPRPMDREPRFGYVIRPIAHSATSDPGLPLELGRLEDRLAVEEGARDADVGDPAGSPVERVAIEDHQVGEATDRDRPRVVEMVR